MPRRLRSGPNARLKRKTRAPAKTGELPAVLFDLDGTLVDSVYQDVQAWHDTLRDEGITVPAWKIHRRVGMSGESFLRSKRPHGSNRGTRL